MVDERASRFGKALKRKTVVSRVPLAALCGRTTLALLVGMVVALTALAAAGCAQEGPPDTTMADLAAQIGALKLDDTDFGAVLPAYTTEAYRANTQPEQADYQLFLAAKAADIGLVKKDTAKVAVNEQAKGATHTVIFDVTKAGGLFQVADISTLTVTLVKAEGGPRSWLIEAIALAR